MKLSVTIMNKGVSPFTLFAEGRVFFRYDYPDRHRFEFCPDSVLILFYHFPRFRKAYIVCEKDRLSGPAPCLLPNVSEPVAVLAAFTSRKFDQLKNSVYHLGKVFPDFARLPLSFFFRLAALIDTGKNADYLVDLLLQKTLEGEEITG
jgi:hypothetical protein